MHFLTQPPRFLFFTGKGGVGKSTLSSQLAYYLSEMTTDTDELEPKYRVGLLDLDICGPSIPHMMGVAD